MKYKKFKKVLILNLALYININIIYLFIYLLIKIFKRPIFRVISIFNNIYYS